MKLAIFTFALVGARLALAQENYDYDDDYNYETAAERDAVRPHFVVEGELEGMPPPPNVEVEVAVGE